MSWLRLDGATGGKPAITHLIVLAMCLLSRYNTTTREEGVDSSQTVSMICSKVPSCNERM